MQNAWLRPQLERALSTQLYGAGGTSETVEIIVKHDVRLLIIPTTSLDDALRYARGYMQLSAETGFAPADTKLALWTCRAETHGAVEASAKYCMSEYADSALRHYELLGKPLEDVHGYEAYCAVSNSLRQDSGPFRHGFYIEHPWSTPDQSIARTKRLTETFGTSEIMFIFKYGRMLMHLAEKSVKLFGREALPALRDIPAQPMQAAA